jgi:hypothetical protein
MPKLFVSGCSYSDCTGINYPWGDCLASMLGYEYNHVAMGAGNNDRTWRILTRKIVSGEITPEDLIIIQYTDLFRRELPASAETFEPLVIPPHDDRPGKPVPWIIESDTPYGKMYTTNLKMGSHTWVKEPHRTLHKMYEETAVDDNWTKEHFFTQHAMFKALCDKYNIRLIILRTQYDAHLAPAQDYYADYENTHFVYSFDILFPDYAADRRPERSEYDLGHVSNSGVIWDTSHLSQVGHITLAEGIKEFIVKNNI